MSEKCPELVSVHQNFVNYLELNCDYLQIDVLLTGISLKDKVFNTNPNTIDDAKEEIQVFAISTKPLHALLCNFIFLIRLLSVTSLLCSMNKYIDIIVSQNTTQFYA